jgi:hypothetical protein
MAYVVRMDPQQQYGPPQSEQWPREAAPPGWGASPPEPEPTAGGSRSAPRARTAVIVLVALLSELVVFAAIGNQSVYDRIVRGIGPHTQGARLALLSWQTYTWRFTPLHNQTGRWGGELALLGVVLVVSGLLIAAVVRGPITFGRAFFGTWTAVVFATLLGAVARGLLDPAAKSQLPGVSRLTRAVFSDVGPNSYAVLAGFALGLVVAFITALAAIASRRPASTATDPGLPETVAPYTAPEAPPPYYGNPGGQYGTGPDVPPWQKQHYAPPAAETPLATDDAQATTQLPSLRPDDTHDTQATTQLPSAHPDAPHSATQQSADQQTMQFPQPPDDDEIARDADRERP